jgi:hypothetical protein
MQGEQVVVLPPHRLQPEQRVGDDRKDREDDDHERPAGKL